MLADADEQAAHRHMKSVEEARSSILDRYQVNAQSQARWPIQQPRAVHSWTRSAAGAWGKDGVRVGAILPAIATMYHEAMSRMNPSEETASFWMNHQSIALGQTTAMLQGSGARHGVLRLTILALSPDN